MGEPREVLALFAKLPQPGAVKTRLAPAIGEVEAARLYEAMLLDVADLHAGPDGRDRVLWFTPPEGRAWFEKSLPPGYRLLEQRGAGLAERMRELFRTHAEEGYERIVLRGTDSPTLPVERVEEAFAALDRHDAVLCPDLDGGYNLIGLCAARDEIFDISMSTGTVLEQTVRRAEAAGMRVRLLDPHHDVDVEADLRRLASGLAGAQAPRTREQLRRLGRA